MPHQPYIDPARPKAKRRPLKAWAHMQQLLADKEDTEQVFHIIEALSGGSAERNLRKFARTSGGRAALASRPVLPPMLDDHDNLTRFPEGSVARAYVAFMTREGLSAAGLVEEDEKFRRGRARFDDDQEFFVNRLRDMHDLYHVLTGYGRDPLGEAALLAFSHSQNSSFGVLFIGFIGARQIAKRSPAGSAAMAAFWEGRRLGKAAAQLVEQDVAALLAEPLDAARERLNIGRPDAYRNARAMLMEAGVTDALAPAE